MGGREAAALCCSCARLEVGVLQHVDAGGALGGVPREADVHKICAEGRGEEVRCREKGGRGGGGGEAPSATDDA
jgi:hypothetical protein